MSANWMSFKKFRSAASRVFACSHNWYISYIRGVPQRNTGEWNGSNAEACQWRAKVIITQTSWTISSFLQTNSPLFPHTVFVTNRGKRFWSQAQRDCIVQMRLKFTAVVRNDIDAIFSRMIGSRLDRIDQKLPKFDLKIKDLKEEEDKVAR